MIFTAKLKEYAAIAFSILMTIVTFGLWARNRGIRAQQLKVDNATVQADVVQANNAQVESRHATDVAINNLPEAPAQTVATADPATAAGKLSSGWTRD